MVAPRELPAAFALRVDPGSTFRTFVCSVDSWNGDSPPVVSYGGLLQDACDFRGSTAPNCPGPRSRVPGGDDLECFSRGQQLRPGGIQHFGVPGRWGAQLRHDTRGFVVYGVRRVPER